jgi:radical SAM superfamily enzyme YgiQ (UPF0313 family)
MRIDIIVINVPRYRRGHEIDFVPPITGIYLAALTPEGHSVRVIHQQVESINFETDADLIGLTFFTGFALEAYRISAEYRKRKKTVVAGGPHVSYLPEESAKHFDSIVIGEAETAWPTLLSDLERGELKPKYVGTPANLDETPIPRYDHLPAKFFVQRVVQATRGCPFSCSFCTVPTFNPGYRMRPVENVIKDIDYSGFRFWWQRKIVWFWDDNLLANKGYSKGLLRRMIPLKKWWLTQASIEICRDDELLSLMKASGCIGVFFGIETFNRAALNDANKPQNLVNDYREAVRKVHEHGIAVMSGLIAGFDSDTPKDIVAMSKMLHKVGIDVPYISILTPYAGTVVCERLKQEDRLLKNRSWNHYNGFNVAFIPLRMSPFELLTTHRTLWKTAFSLKAVLLRTLRSVLYLRLGSFLMVLFMNMFYGFKRLTRNYPIEFDNFGDDIAYEEAPVEVLATGAAKDTGLRKSEKNPEMAAVERVYKS